MRSLMGDPVPERHGRRSEPVAIFRFVVAQPEATTTTTTATRKTPHRFDHFPPKCTIVLYLHTLRRAELRATGLRRCGRGMPECAGMTLDEDRHRLLGDQEVGDRVSTAAAAEQVEEALAAVVGR